MHALTIVFALAVFLYFLRDALGLSREAAIFYALLAGVVLLTALFLLGVLSPPSALPH